MPKFRVTTRVNANIRKFFKGSQKTVTVAAATGAKARSKVNTIVRGLGRVISVRKVKK